MTDYRKMVLLEAAELDRIRQRQIREYDPNLSAMAKAQSQIDDILLNDKLSDSEKLALMNHAQHRYDAIKAKIGPLHETKLALNPVQPIVNADQQFQDTMSSSGTQTHDEISKDLDPSLIPDYQILKRVIAENPKLVKSNRAGELVIKNKAVKGTNFNDIIKSLLTGEKVDSTPGVSDFVRGIQSLNLSDKNFTSTHLLDQLYQSSPSVTISKFKQSTKSSPSHFGFTSITPPPPPPSPTTTSSSSFKSKISTRKSQKGHGIHYPPGKRPRILWLYR